MGRALVWGIKQGFRDYVAELPDGTTELLDGATLLDHQFVFAATDAPHRFRGAIRFRGHGGMLDVTLANPYISREGSECNIYMAEVVGENSGASSTKFARLHVNNPSMNDQDVNGVGLVATLTTLGAELLGGVYQVGTPLDPVHFVTLS